MTDIAYNLSRPNGYGGAGEVLDHRRAHSMTEAMAAYRTGDTLIARPATGPGMLTRWAPVTAAELDALDTEGMPPYAVRKLDDYRRALDAPAAAAEDAASSVSSQAGLASIRGGLPLAVLRAVTARNVAAGNVIVEKSAVPTGHAHTAAYQGPCTGECGV